MNWIDNKSHYMTYILGWKNYSSVFLVGDSVITIEHPNVDGNKNTFRNQTSFGEDHIYEEGKTVSEKWLKLYDLDNKVILAISGDVEDAHEGIKNLRICIDSKIDIYKGIESSFRDREVDILVGFMEEDVPRLISYNGRGKRGLKEYAFFEVAHSGSIDSSFIDQTEEFFSQIDSKDWSEDQILASIIAVTQSYGFQENQMKRGVGGFFSGIRINERGVSWQPDLVFIPFSYNGKELKSNQLAEILGEAKFVITQVRESILFSGSTFISDPKKATRPFSNFLPEQIIETKEYENARCNWAAKWGREVNKNWEECKADFYIFYNTDKPIVALVYSNEKKPFIVNENSFGFRKKEGFLSLVTLLFSKADEELTLYTEF